MAFVNVKSDEWYKKELAEAKRLESLRLKLKTFHLKLKRFIYAKIKNILILAFLNEYYTK
jgi:hypothetical protein